MAATGDALGVDRGLAPCISDMRNDELQQLRGDGGINLMAHAADSVQQRPMNGPGGGFTPAGVHHAIVIAVDDQSGCLNAVQQGGSIA